MKSTPIDINLHDPVHIFLSVRCRITGVVLAIFSLFSLTSCADWQTTELSDIKWIISNLVESTSHDAFDVDFGARWEFPVRQTRGLDFIMDLGALRKIDSLHTVISYKPKIGSSIHADFGVYLSDDLKNWANSVAISERSSNCNRVIDFASQAMRYVRVTHTEAIRLNGWFISDLKAYDYEIGPADIPSPEHAAEKPKKDHVNQRQTDAWSIYHIADTDKYTHEQSANNTVASDGKFVV
ncbi:MAG: hypothetical protein AB8B87_01575 [Granulosicoccus sp.]